MLEPLVGNQYLLDTLALVYILYSFYLMPTICHLSRRCCCLCHRRFMSVCVRCILYVCFWCVITAEHKWISDMPFNSGCLMMCKRVNRPIFIDSNAIKITHTDFTYFSRNRRSSIRFISPSTIRSITFKIVGVTLYLLWFHIVFFLLLFITLIED